MSTMRHLQVGVRSEQQKQDWRRTGMGATGTVGFAVVAVEGWVAVLTQQPRDNKRRKGSIPA